MSNPLKMAAMRWTYPSINGTRVQIPWDENQPQYGKYHLGFAKATRRQIIDYTEANCSFTDRWAIENWMKGKNPMEIHIGIDCSGFVYRMLEEACLISGAATLVETLGTTCEYTTIDALTPLSMPIDRAMDVRAGDTMRFNHGRHSGVIIETVTDPRGTVSEIWYAHSSYTRGPHIGWIEVGDQTAPINAPMQQWHDDMWDGLVNNNLRDRYFTSVHKSWFYQGPRIRIVKRKGLTIAVSGRLIDFAVGPFILDSTAMCHVRPLAEAMGARVDWKQPPLMVTLTKGGRSASCQVGSEVAVVNGRQITLDQVPIFLGESVFVPVRFIAEALGYRVDFRGDSFRVDLTPL